MAETGKTKRLNESYDTLGATIPHQPRQPHWNFKLPPGFKIKLIITLCILWLAEMIWLVDTSYSWVISVSFMVLILIIVWITDWKAFKTFLDTH